MYVLISLSDWITSIKHGGFDEYIVKLLNDYRQLGPLPGILLPFIESILPLLPLFVIILANSAAYGLLNGFLYSWIGTSLGSIFVFYMVRKLGGKRIFLKVRNNKQVAKVTTWVEKHGFGPLFLLLCFPFSPSSVINVVAGLSSIRSSQFILAVILGKSVMVFSISYIGDSLTSFAQNPIKTISVGVGIIIFWIIGKHIENKINKKSLETISK